MRRLGGRRRQIGSIADEWYGRLPPPPSAFKRTQVKSKSMEAGCPAREGPLCRGRGEATWDCVGIVEPSRTATVDRTIILPSPGFEAPARFVGK